MGKITTTLLFVAVLLPVTILAQSVPTSRPSDDAALRRIIFKLQMQIAALRDSQLHRAIIDQTAWRLDNSAILKFSASQTVTCDKWNGTTRHYEYVDPRTISWIDPDGTGIRVTFTADGNAMLLQCMTGSKTGVVISGTLVGKPVPAPALASNGDPSSLRIDKSMSLEQMNAEWGKPVDTVSGDDGTMTYTWDALRDATSSGGQVQSLDDSIDSMLAAGPRRKIVAREVRATFQNGTMTSFEDHTIN